MTDDRPQAATISRGLDLTPIDDADLAFLKAMDQWERSLKRPDMQERDRVMGALQAYQRQLDALVITRHRRKP